jgi:8-oxo-dGTP diphosphatase
MPYTYDFQKANLTVDIILLRQKDVGCADVDSPPPEVLLIQRKHDPFAGCWAFPGGFVNPYEGLEHAALRELEEETGLVPYFLNQWQAVSDTNPDDLRDPRGWSISVVFNGEVSYEDGQKAVGNDDAEKAQWFPLNKLPPLAFDHAEILRNFVRDKPEFK